MERRTLHQEEPLFCGRGIDSAFGPDAVGCGGCPFWVLLLFSLLAMKMLQLLAGVTAVGFSVMHDKNKGYEKMKRTDYLLWDEYFMGVALLSAQRSKDPSTQVGACIVDSKNKIVGVGYNGFPLGCDDDDLPWDREGDFLETKYPYVCHAELNAVLNSTRIDLSDCKIYTTLFPCHECSKVLIQTGIKNIIYYEDKYADTESVKAAKRMLDQANVAYNWYTQNKRTMSLDL